MKDQLQALRKEKRFTQEEAAVQFGVKLSTYQKYEREAISPPYDLLIRIADFYGVSTDYLLGRTEIRAMAGDNAGHAGLPGLGADEEAALKKWLSLGESIRRQILGAMIQIAEAAKLGRGGELRPVIYFARCHRMKASAGAGFDLDNADQWRGVRIYDCPEAHAADFAVEVDGSSMSPDYEDGDIVFVRLANEVPVGAAGLFIHDGKGYIKERGEKCLISRNPDHPDIYGEAKTVGLVIGKAEPAV